MARQIQARLYQDATLKTRDISVIVQQGVVILSGQVQSEEERMRAERVASGVEGAKQVINQLVVVSAPPAELPAAPVQPTPGAHPARAESQPAAKR